MWSEITAIDLDRRRSKVNCQPPETSQTVKSNDGLCVIQKWKWQLELFFLFWSNSFLFLASDESPSSKPHRKRQSRLFLMFTFEMEIAERSRVHCSSSCEQVKAAMWGGGGGMDGSWWRRGTVRAALQRTRETLRAPTSYIHGTFVRDATAAPPVTCVWKHFAALLLTKTDQFVWSLQLSLAMSSVTEKTKTSADLLTPQHRAEHQRLTKKHATLINITN